MEYAARPIGRVGTTPVGQPKPTTVLHVLGGLLPGLRGLTPGHQLLVVTWLHGARRDRLDTDLRSGVFASSCAHRPNPIGLHTVTLLALTADGMTVDQSCGRPGTPVLDVRPARFPG